MALTADQRKQLLGYGGLAKAARRSGRTKTHVTQVNQHPEIRPDQKVMRAITREIVRRHPEISPADVWPVVMA